MSDNELVVGDQPVHIVSGLGLSDHQLLLEVRTEVRAINTFIHSEFSRRPTRQELWGYLGAAGVLSGVIVGLMGFA
jgi:hypothetical protein